MSLLFPVHPRTLSQRLIGNSPQALPAQLASGCYPSKDTLTLESSRVGAVHGVTDTMTTPAARSQTRFLLGVLHREIPQPQEVIKTVAAAQDKVVREGVRSERLLGSRLDAQCDAGLCLVSIRAPLGGCPRDVNYGPVLRAVSRCAHTPAPAGPESRPSHPRNDPRVKARDEAARQQVPVSPSPRLPAEALLPSGEETHALCLGFTLRQSLNKLCGALRESNSERHSRPRAGLQLSPQEVVPMGTRLTSQASVVLATLCLRSKTSIASCDQDATTVTGLGLQESDVPSFLWLPFGGKRPHPSTQHCTAGSQEDSPVTCLHPAPRGAEVAINTVSPWGSPCSQAGTVGDPGLRDT
ncbi:hypothetical protein H920_00801 [Fukomys damarensis]|uniref:Uncharacterized protein n=1 Tax=Fukomys damarensis TaxID=885580 RepID=A0A091E386_FUKDA|nr:hypothetical protein H920_00801 [Fukomys damarensis]